jgi:hypothetical protein
MQPEESPDASISFGRIWARKGPRPAVAVLLLLLARLIGRFFDQGGLCHQPPRNTLKCCGAKAFGPVQPAWQNRPIGRSREPRGTKTSRFGPFVTNSGVSFRQPTNQVAQSRTPGLVLTRQADRHFMNPRYDVKKGGVRGHAHRSIRIQEGQPNLAFGKICSAFSAGHEKA